MAKKEKIKKKIKDDSKNLDKRKSWLTRKFGFWLVIIGIAMQFLNILTYGLWGIDIDIFGALIFIIGVVIIITKWRQK